MAQRTKRVIVYKTQSLAKAFDKLSYYELLEPKIYRKYFVRLEFAQGERKTFEYTNTSDARDRLLGSYRHFIQLTVTML